MKGKWVGWGWAALAALALFVVACHIPHHGRVLKREHHEAWLQLVPQYMTVGKQTELIGYTQIWHPESWELLVDSVGHRGWLEVSEQEFQEVEDTIP
jgi:hypothetical protein